MTTYYDYFNEIKCEANAFSHHCSKGHRLYLLYGRVLEDMKLTRSIDGIVGWVEQLPASLCYTISIASVRFPGAES